ncbi:MULTISPECIES: LysR family transcriptional regulator [unclassified Enterococcus]|uniref:LysR family transcriptional regulator n=1 Tax=unclassified Enterococcus TaxID=2608891 RepID=UPI0015577573|nr:MULTISPECIES: LysR family transcriptional regulator [unclassified Enterococcus]MBS7576426.1 LysR family transcriptional regulator [Enterococcus sp. MMGLQ5-2]MBS7583658.1 LysR family transcriptional regulator [Enterococcus sp. MMGLQ5-1]NPD11519.1 LysR family transcriptional regulator [Enterococcus sp. MMGLQ5-1]NPD36263.1 LysR family transcriptional regulator [Enterococcus sp. MMGLQ5-2]
MFKNLETFKLVYETRSFSKTAELLFLAQPTVSSQIKQLEAELKTQLFIRNGRREVVSTQQADILYQKAIQMLDDWQAIQILLNKQRGHSISYTIGASHTFASYLLPDLFQEIYLKFPNIHFKIKLMNSLEVHHALEQHEINLGFIEKPINSKKIIRTTLISDQLVLAGNQNKGPWLIREATSGVYYYTKQYIEENNINEATIEIQNNSIITQLLEQGFGCSIISKRAVKSIPYQVLSEKYTRDFYLIQRKEEATEHFEYFINYIKRYFQKLKKDH